MATAVTVLALPFLLQSGKATPGVAAVASPGGSGKLTDALPSPEDTTPPLPADAVILTRRSDRSTTSQEIVIAVPTSPPDGSKFAKGKAGYQTWQLTANGRPCLFTGAPLNTVLTVTNLDNGKSTTCLVAGNQAPASGLVIMLHSTVFQDIADLVEAPVPVRVAWNG